jgi:hypothetical protein
MKGVTMGLLTGLLEKPVLATWRRVAEQIDTAPETRLRRIRNSARALRQQLDSVIHVADGRLARSGRRSGAVARPHGTDWAWRPKLWRGPLARPGLSSVDSKSRLGDDITIFHDCSRCEISMRQRRSHRDDDPAPFALAMDVFRFEGTFLSLVVDLPGDVADGLTKSHLIRIETEIESERPQHVFLRLNIMHGPNTEQIVRELPEAGTRTAIEFDLAYSKLNERRIERAWLDIIFGAPEMNAMEIRDLTFARLLRAMI